MSDITDFYRQQIIRTATPAMPWHVHWQQKALADFERFGFPDRANESWKYTRVDSFVKERFTAADIITAPPSVPHPTTDIPVPLEIALINGAVVGLDSVQRALPPGVIVQPLVRALIDHPDKVKPHLGRILQHEHGFHALNSAMLQQGLFIYLPPGARLSDPLLLTHRQTISHQAMYIRHLIVAEAGSSASIIEDYQGDAGACYFTNTVTEVFVNTNATLVHYKMQRESTRAYHAGHVCVKQAAGAQFNSHLFSLGGQWVRNDVSIHLQEPSARCLMNGLYLPSDGQHMDQHTVVHHEAPNCDSEQDYKGILTGHSRAVFDGKVVVARDAQKTCAKQQNKNLLLSNTAEIDTKPQLNIYADDVVCTHGATVGQLDEEALFYLATRGIDRIEASQYLIQAFVMDNLRMMNEPTLVSWMHALLNQHIGLLHGQSCRIG